jgi:uncharacterized protein YbbC (DUF1343 family)
MRLSRASMLIFQRVLTLALILLLGGCQAVTSHTTTNVAGQLPAPIQVGAQQYSAYLPLLKDKRVSLVVNHSARVPTGESDSAHLLDALLSRDVNVVSIMSPEHGFRGQASAGERVQDDVDSRTGLPIHSLYGKTKKPTARMLKNVDVLVFDIQDVGVRFYTYLSTLHYILDAAAEQGITVVVLDRPNPNGQFTDGPILTPDFQSFVGMHPIPVLHGMTLGELALMIKGEQWIDGADSLLLHVVPVAHYNKTMHYSLPMAPSPNLPNDNAIALYPTLCFFEGTSVSIGRGTDIPFLLIGHPSVSLGDKRISVTPNTGAIAPKYNGDTLYAELLTPKNVSGLDLMLLLNTYQTVIGANEVFFTRPQFFDKLAGTDALRLAMINGDSASAIKETWREPLATFKAKRAPYLLYSTKKYDDAK